MKKFVGIAALMALLVAGAATAIGDGQTVRDRAKDTAELKRKGELDIVRATAGHAIGGKLKHKITMRERLKPGQKNTRPFILINTRGDATSDFEFLVLGPRVFKVTRKGKFRKVGANKFSARKRTWVYRFPASTFGDPESYGWAALTAKGGTSDLAPNRRYKEHRTAP